MSLTIGLSLTVLLIGAILAITMTDHDDGGRP